MQEYRSCTSALQRVLAQTNTVHLGPVALGSLALKYRFSSAYICSFPHMQFHWPSPKYLSHHTGSPFLGGHSYIYVNTYLKTAPAVLFHRSIQCYRPVKVSKYAFFFSFISTNWRPITLQHCRGFCHTLTWISHGFTCIPHPDPPCPLPLHPIPCAARREGFRILLCGLVAEAELLFYQEDIIMADIL